jgi:hypothetical protein
MTPRHLWQKPSMGGGELVRVVRQGDGDRLTVMCPGLRSTAGMYAIGCPTPFFWGTIQGRTPPQVLRSAQISPMVVAYGEGVGRPALGTRSI